MDYKNLRDYYMDCALDFYDLKMGDFFPQNYKNIMNSWKLRFTNCVEEIEEMI